MIESYTYANTHNHSIVKHMSRIAADELMQIARSKIKPDDITHRGFLKPIEIALKTYNTEMFDSDSNIKPGSLPCGLKVAVKAPDSDKRTLRPIETIQPNHSYLTLTENSQDNLLSLMKRPEGIEIAICVCMYSEDKKMLKSTLAGIAENIANIVAYENVDPDKIGVFIMMDGIEKVDRSVVEYFEELEKTSNINLGDNIVPSLTVAEMDKRANSKTEDEINEEEMRNVNNFLFDVAELDERNSLRFEAIEKDYAEKKKLMKEIKELLKQKPLYDNLPNRLQGFFIDEARSKWKEDYALTDEQAREITKERLQDEYGNDVNQMRPLIVKTLHRGEQYCKNYIQSRQDLAYLSCFRKKVQFELKHFPENERAERQRRYRVQSETQFLAEEIDETELSTVMNLFMCVKYKNSGKLSSHNWFFNGFCKELRPAYAVLLDVGLKTEGEALLKMYRYMKEDLNVGGVCGYMSLKIQKLDESDELKDEEVDFLTSLVNKFVDIQRTQQVEYHFAHLMDKPFEASFGFIHVLPGAFSAYNMKAIIDYYATDDDILLRSYFKSIDEKMAGRKVVTSEVGVSNAILRTILPDFLNSYCINVDSESDEALLYDENVYLAEDRILCMGIHKKGFDMAFLPDAYAEVDPMKTVHGLLGQRKRWINGSYFAFEKVRKELKVHQEDIGCEVMLNLQIFYLSFMNALSYFAPSFFLFTVHIAMDAFRQDVLSKLLAGVVNDTNNSSMVYNGFVFTMDFIYVLLIMTVIFYSLHLTNNHKRFKPYIYGVSTIFGLFMITVFAVLTVDIFRGLFGNSVNFLVQNQNAIQAIPGGASTVDTLRWMLTASLLIYAIPITAYILLFGRASIMCEIILGSFSFLFYTPTYLSILNIYSLCRIDDISWGTKGLDSGSTKSSDLKDSWKLIKFIHVAKYVIWNILISSVLMTLGSSYASRFFVTIGMVILIGLSMSLKVFVGVYYMIAYRIKTCCYGDKEPRATSASSIRQTIDRYQPEIMEDIENNLANMRDEYAHNHAGSFIQASRTKRATENALQKQSNMSKIIRTGGTSLVRSPLFSIPEEPGRNPGRKASSSASKQRISKLGESEKKINSDRSQEETSKDNLLDQERFPGNKLPPIHSAHSRAYQEVEHKRDENMVDSRGPVNPPKEAAGEFQAKGGKVDKNKFRR